MQNTDAKTKRSKKSVVKAVLCITAAVCILLISFGGRFGIPGWNDIFTACGVYADMSDGLSAGFVNVGTADACCIKYADKQILIDSGTQRLSQKLTSFLERYDFKRFDAIIISHLDNDHYGGAADIIKQYGVDKIYLPKTSADLKPDSEEYSRFISCVQENGVELIYTGAGDGFELSGVSVDFISPAKEYTSRNDNSLIVRLTYGNNKFLFTGDVSSKVEKDLLSSNADLNADVLKVAHHGSKTSSCEEFLEAVSPEISVVSVGASDLSNPDYDTMARINSYSSSVYTTADDYSIVVNSDGENLTVYTDA